MADRNSDNRKDRIHERIVPRNNFKRILTLTLTVIAMALIFGLVAGVAFKIGETLVGQNVETRIEQFIIARDDTEDSTEDVPETRTEAGETAPDETEAEPSTEAGSREESSSVPEPSIIPTGPEPPPAETEEEIPGVAEILKRTKKSIVEVTVEKNSGIDFFNTEIIDRYSTIGVFVAESNENAYFLMDDSRFEETDRISILIGNTYYPAEFVQRDSLTGMMACRIPLKSLRKDTVMIPLGNSFRLSVTDKVYMVGTQTGKPISFSKGMITCIDSPEAIEDGYTQHIYTDMACAPDTTAVLLNENGELIGWVSQFYCGSDSLASAGGISPLKYVIEDLCSGIDTARVGMICTYVSSAMARSLGVEEGLYVGKVEADSPAFAAGIQVGDLLVSIGGKKISGNSGLASRLDEYKPGDQAVFELMRGSAEGNSPLELIVTFGAR